MLHNEEQGAESADSPSVCRFRAVRLSDAVQPSATTVVAFPGTMGNFGSTLGAPHSKVFIRRRAATDVNAVYIRRVHGWSCRR